MGGGLKKTMAGHVLTRGSGQPLFVTPDAPFRAAHAGMPVQQGREADSTRCMLSQL